VTGEDTNSQVPIPVAVWLMDGDTGEPDDPIRLLRAIAHINGGDLEFACRVAEGTDRCSARPWKAVIAAPVTCKAAEVVVRWIEAEGGHASIDDGYYEDDDYVSVWAKAASVEEVSA
jgi:hypothetical protein